MIDGKRLVSKRYSVSHLGMRSLAMSACMVTLFAASCVFAQSSPDATPSLDENQRLASKVAAIFESKCLACHGNQADHRGNQQQQ